MFASSCSFVVNDNTLRCLRRNIPSKLCAMQGLLPGFQSCTYRQKNRDNPFIRCLPNRRYIVAFFLGTTLLASRARCPRESGGYAFRGTRVGEASHPGPEEVGKLSGMRTAAAQYTAPTARTVPCRSTKSSQSSIGRPARDISLGRRKPANRLITKVAFAFLAVLRSAPLEVSPDSPSKYSAEVNTMMQHIVWSGQRIPDVQQILLGLKWFFKMHDRSDMFFATCCSDRWYAEVSREGFHFLTQQFNGGGRTKKWQRQLLGREFTCLDVPQSQQGHQIRKTQKTAERGSRQRRHDYGNFLDNIVTVLTAFKGNRPGWFLWRVFHPRIDLPAWIVRELIFFWALAENMLPTRQLPYKLGQDWISFDDLLAFLRENSFCFCDSDACIWAKIGDVGASLCFVDKKQSQKSARFFRISPQCFATFKQELHTKLLLLIVPGLEKDAVCQGQEETTHFESNDNYDGQQEP